MPRVVRHVCGHSVKLSRALCRATRLRMERRCNRRASKLAASSSSSLSRRDRRRRGVFNMTNQHLAALAVEGPLQPHPSIDQQTHSTLSPAGRAPRTSAARGPCAETAAHVLQRSQRPPLAHPRAPRSASRRPHTRDPTQASRGHPSHCCPFLQAHRHSSALAAAHTHTLTGRIRAAVSFTRWPCPLVSGAGT
jgi:hypothetical protein